MSETQKKSKIVVFNVCIISAAFVCGLVICFVRGLSAHSGVFMLLLLLCAVSGIVANYQMSRIRTEALLSEARLKKTFDKLQSVYSAAQCAIIKCRNDDQWTLIEANDKFYDMIGYTSEEFLCNKNNSITAIIHKDYLKQHKIIAADLHAGGIYSEEDCFVRKDGSLIYIWDQGMLVNEEGNEYFYATYVDVSKQKKKEDEMQTLIASMPGGVCRYSEDTDRLEFVSDNMLTMLGYTKEEFQEKFNFVFSNMIYEKDRKKVIRSIRKQIATGDEYFCEYRIETGSGELKWFYDVGHIITDEKGKRSFYVVIVDITEQKRVSGEMEERYQKEVAYRENLEDDNVLASLRANLSKNRIEDYSLHYEFHEGLGEEENYNEYIKIVSDANLQSEASEQLIDIFGVDSLLAKYRDGKSEVVAEYVRMNKTGKKTWIRTVAKFAKMPGSEDVIAFLYSYDINSRKILRDMMEHASNKIYDMMIYIDNTTGDFTVYSAESDSAEVLQGDDEYIAKVIGTQKEMLDADEQEVIEKISLKTVKERLEKSNDYIFPVKFTDKSGDIKVKRMHYSYMNAEKKIIILIRTDITDLYVQEQKQQEAMKQALISAQQANSAKSSFLTNMSHDIRTPLNVIVGMTALAETDIEDKDKVMGDLAVIASSSKHLLELINDILDMSRIESGTMVIACESYDLEEEIVKLKQVVLPMFEEKHQEFKINRDKLINTKIIGDAVRLQRILMNLLGNASKFTPENGHISLTLEEMPSDNKKIINLRIMVADDGVGISKEKQKDVFDPFVRDTDRTDEQIEGTGLGLAIVKSITTAKGGTVRLESEPGKGSVFTVELPLKADVDINNNVESVVDPEEEIRELPGIEGVKILLVDDQPVNIMMTKRLLENNGAIVDTAKNGAEGYDKFMTGSPDQYDIIFMDIQMPVMNGYEATKVIRESGHVRAKTIPIVAMTANVFAEDIVKSEKAGMDAHLAKPIDLKNIFITIDRLIGDGGYRDDD